MADIPPTSSVPHYDRAPIVEAIFDVDITPLGEENISSLEALGSRISETYPRMQPRRSAALPFHSAAVSESEGDGYVFISEDGKQIVQARLDGFSFSRFSPYDRWETFIGEARRTWEAYYATAASLAVRSFSVRYINELLIPFGHPLNQFFNIYPALPDQTKLLSNLLMLVELPTDEMSGRVSILMSFLGASPGGARIGLDNTFSFHATSVEDIWQNMGVVRKMKNDLFQSQIREELKNTFGDGS